jgi:hypothetical protein
LKKPTTFHDTTHAGKRSQERGLSVEQMKIIVCGHERRIQHRLGEHGGFVCEFTKSIQGIRWTVIAEVKHSECWLITGWQESDEN